MLARYYWLPTNGRLSFCTVESGSPSNDDSAIDPASSSLARTTTKPMVRACARLVLRKHQHQLVAERHLNLVVSFYYLKGLDEVDLFNISGVDRGK